MLLLACVVCGIHIYNQGAQLGDDIKQWDVKILMVRGKECVLVVVKLAGAIDRSLRQAQSGRRLLVLGGWMDAG